MAPLLRAAPAIVLTRVFGDDTYTTVRGVQPRESPRAKGSAHCTSATVVRSISFLLRGGRQHTGVRMPRTMSPLPSVESLKNRAKALLRDARSRSPEALARFTACFPRLVTEAATTRAPALAPLTSDRLFKSPFKLGQAQEVLAREYGFPNWPSLCRAAAAASPSRHPWDFVLVFIHGRVDDIPAALSDAKGCGVVTTSYPPPWASLAFQNS